MKTLVRQYPNSRMVSIVLLLAGMLVSPIFVLVLFGRWSESPMRQAVGFAALFGIWALAFVKKKHEILSLAIIFLSQFMVSLTSFELAPPVVQTVVLFDIFIVILLVQFFAIGEKLTIRHSAGWAFLALIAWQLLITPISAHIDRSISFTITQAKFLLLYLTVSNLSLGEKFYRQLPWAICGILLVQTSLELAQLQLGYLGLAVLGEGDPSKSYLNYFEGTLRAAGTLGATNGLGGYMAAALVFLMPFLLTKASIARYAIFFVGLIGLVIPLSRAGWLSFLVGLMIVIFQMFRGRITSPLKILALSALAVLMLSGVAFMKWEVISQRFTDKGAQASAEGRAGQFPYAWEMSMKNPLFGIGPGVSNFYGSWTDFYKYIRDAEQTKDVRFEEQVHNSLLQYLLESGLPGAALFVWLFVATLANALSKIDRNSQQQLIRMGAAAAAFTCMLHTQFGPEINNQQLMILFAFALGVSNNKHLSSISTRHKHTQSN